jgi:hypothetical protein
MVQHQALDQGQAYEGQVYEYGLLQFRFVLWSR